jgi:hypothetical protein
LGEEHADQERQQSPGHALVQRRRQATNSLGYIHGQMPYSHPWLAGSRTWSYDPTILTGEPLFLKIDLAARHRVYRKVQQGANLKQF